MVSNAIADALNNYWEPLWNSSEEPTREQLDLFQEMLEHFPMRLQGLTIDPGLQQWKRAIKKIKGSTARGFDGLSAWEAKQLPDSIVEFLGAVMLGYDTGYPAWYMQARTAPIPKTDRVPEPFEIRPITILPLTYRLYASMFCHQVLRQWHHVFPVSVTGLLPTRGSRDAAYHAQALIEEAASRQKRLSGVTLDLQKCYNNIWHHIAPMLMDRLGIPSEYTMRWLSSLKNLTRYWDINSCCLGPIPTNRGFPEGDTHSVLIMLAIALWWTLEVKRQSNAQAEPTAYADNWTWYVLDESLHEPAARITLLITSLCGLRIDWGKTWLFATTTEAAQRATEALQRAIPQQDVARLHHARDLGFEMRYSGGHRVGHRADRHCNGQHRLRRLQHLHADTEEKEKLWTVSIFPQAFYGAEICPPSSQVIKQYQSKLADAIFGPSSSMAPAIALLFGAKRILDPGYMLIWQALHAAKRWLHNVTQSHRDRFFRLAANFQGGLSSVRGPASALTHYLAELNWTIDKAGFLLIGPFTKLNLYTSSLQQLKRALTLAWQQGLFIRFTLRKHLFWAPPISRIDTVALLNSLNNQQRRALIREISGAFQTQHQQSQW